MLCLSFSMRSPLPASSGGESTSTIDVQSAQGGKQQQHFKTGGGGAYVQLTGSGAKYSREEKFGIKTLP